MSAHQGGGGHGGAGRDGGGDSDSKAARASDEWASLAQLARTAFRAHNYQASLEHLHRMAKLRPDDPKVQHNIMIAQYHQGAGADPAKLLIELVKLKQRMDDSATRDDEEGALAVELSSALIRYNQALLSFSMKQYADALAILEPLFRNIDPLEFVAVKVSYLLLEAYITTRQTDKALQVVSFIEKTYLRPPSPPAAHAASEQVPTLLGQTTDEDSGENSSLGAGLPHMAPRVVGPPPSITSIGELKASLHLSRARVHLLLRAFPAAKRELKQATALIAPSSPLLIGCMFLKAHVEYARANFRKAVKLLNVIHHPDPSAALAPAGPLGASDRTLRALYYADLGAIHFRLKKFRAAAYYLSTALKEQPVGAAKVAPFARREELLYNLGMCYLQLREGELAFTCFAEALTGLARTPRRCLRLAEAAVMAHAARARAETVSVEVHQAPSPPRRCMVFSATPVSGEEQAAMDAMLESAVRYLTTALLLVSTSRTPAPASAPASGASPGPFAPTPAAAPAPNPRDAADAHVIRVHALANLSYCQLALGNAAAALSAAFSLLAIPDVPAAHSFSAHLFAAEALCMLNRIPEALTHVSPAMADNLLSLHAPADASASSAFRVQFYTSLAVVHCLEDEMDKAQSCVNSALALLQAPPATPLLLLQVYVELRRGNTDEALATLRRGRCRVVVRSPATRPTPPRPEKSEKR